MQPIRAGAPREEWRTKPVIDLTGDDVISTPRDFPTFSTPVTRPVFTSVNDAAAVQNHIAVQKPSVYSLPAGGAIPGFTNFGGGYVDTAKTTESIKELLEGFNDLPVPKKRGKKKKKSKENKKEVDELAGIMAGTALGGAEDDLAKSLEDAEAKDEEEDDEEEEDMSHVDGLKVTLLPHQIRGLAFLLSREEGKNLGGILADDVGSHSGRLLFSC